jgi:hypothetical protein
LSSTSHYAPNTNQLITNYSFTTRSLALSLALFLSKKDGWSGISGLSYRPVCVSWLASTDAVFRCVHPVHTRASGCSAQPRASGRNTFSPAVTPLLMLRCPAARVWAGAFREARDCSRGVAKRAVPLLQNETQNMNTNENHIATECLATAPQPINQVVQPVKFPAQPQEWKIVSLRECPTPDTMQHCETPDQAAAYWKTHIATHPYFNSECECLVVFILNTRRRIKGHYLVSIGTMDTILCHPREVFRLAIMASASAIIIAHNHPSGVIPHPVLCRM